MMQQLKPMTWPRPVPLLWLSDDYSDIRERIRRTGRLDTDEIWLPQSEDGWGSFCARHGTYGFDYDWMALQQRDRDERAAQRLRNSVRLAAQARRAQETWEATRQQRQLALQAEADRQWQEIVVAKAEWGRVDPGYAAQPYRLTAITTAGSIVGVRLEAGNSYWLPQSIVDVLRGNTRAAA